MTLYHWSSTAGDNGTADATVGMAEGMAPSAVNDGVRAAMAAVAKARNDWSGMTSTGGTSVAYTFTTNQNFDTLAHLSNNKLKVRFHTTNGASPTLNVDGLGAESVFVNSNTAVTAGTIGGNSIWDVTYDNSIPAFILNGVAGAVQAGTVNSTAIAAGAVTYAKIQNVTDQRLLGNFSGGAAAPSELSVVGPAVTSTSLTFPSPVPGDSKNLIIKVLSNTTVQVTADWIVVNSGTSFQTLQNLNATIDLGANGAINRLDTGTIAIDTWYYIYPAAKADGTAGALASINSTTPTLPAGYTYYSNPPGAAVQTIHGSATLYGTQQNGNKAQYVVGLAQTANLPQVTSGAVGSATVPTWVSQSLARFVPPTAKRVNVSLFGFNSGAAVNGMAAPNSSYGAITSSTNPPPVAINTAAGQVAVQPAEILLESANPTNIYWAATGSTALYVTGWSG